MSSKATGWAWSCRTGDTTTKCVLAAFADYAHPDGTAAFPSLKTVAADAECSKDTVKRHLKTLLEEGFMRPGDQQLVAHIRADRRPVVYDLAMSEETRLLWKASHARGGSLHPRTESEPSEDGGADCTPVDPEPGSTPAPPSTGHGGAHGGAPETSRGCTGAPQTNYELPDTPQPPAERGATDASSTTAGAGCAGCRGQRPCRACGTTPRQLEEAERRAVDQRRREANDDAIQADRRRKDATSHVDGAAHARQARDLLAAARSGGES